MTRLALKNPIFVLMLCIALVVFASVVTPRMSVDTFPELSPPVLVIGTKASGMGPKDVEKTITWRLEKAVSATPGVDHVESISRSGLSVIFVWLKWGTDLNAAQSTVQQQVAFAMSSVPKTLGIIPPFILQYDPSNAPIMQIAVHGGGLSEAQIYDYAANNVEPLIEGIPGVASASPNGGKAADQRHRRPGQGCCAGALVERRRPGHRALQRALAFRALQPADLLRQRVHQCGPFGGGRHR